VTEQEPAKAQVVRLDEGRCEEAVAVFVDAFDDDPWAHYLFRGDQRAFRRDVGNLYRALVKVRLAQEEPVLGVEIGGRLVGAATLEEPGRPSSFADGFQTLECARATLGLVVQAGLAATRRLVAYGSAVTAGRSPEPQFYLLGLAVVRSEQGNGFGGMLLDAVHAIVEARSDVVGIGLDTDTPENVSLYQHFGYETTAVVDVGGLAMSCMFRRNAQAAR
jgi:GNAT superfamily N-acetyltransferase